jgi:hypothetical protein
MSRERRRGVWAGAAGTVVLAAVIAGVVHLGSPADLRRRRLDAERVSDLRSLSHQIEEHWRRNGALPATTSEVSSQAWSDEIGRDPETAVPYEYLPLEERRYRLCGVFALPSPQPRQPTEPDFWRHPAGPHCYDIEITEKSP